MNWWSFLNLKPLIIMFWYRNIMYHHKCNNFSLKPIFTKLSTQAGNILYIFFLKCEKQLSLLYFNKTIMCFAIKFVKVYKRILFLLSLFINCILRHLFCIYLLCKHWKKKQWTNSQREMLTFCFFCRFFSLT